MQQYNKSYYSYNNNSSKKATVSCDNVAKGDDKRSKLRIRFSKDEEKKKTNDKMRNNNNFQHHMLLTKAITVMLQVHANIK